jgi:DNA-binding response OmpR family regulator
MSVMTKINVLALGNPLKMQRIAACVSRGNINISSVSQFPEAIIKLQDELFEVILVDSLFEKAESICHHLYNLYQIPVILLIEGDGANWPSFSNYKVDGFLSEESSNLELVARLKASARRKYRSQPASVDN